MKLPARPRVLFISEPPIGTYEYIFAKFHLGFERLGCPLAKLNPYSTTLELYRASIADFKPDIIFAMLRSTEPVRIVARLLDEYHSTLALNWFQEDPNNVTRDMLECSKSFDFWFTQDPRTVPFWKTRAYFSPHAFDESVYDDRRLERIYDVSYVGQLGNPLCKAMLWPYLDTLSRQGKKALICTERPMGPPLMPLPVERFLRWKRSRPLLQALPVWRCGWENPRNELEKALVINRSKIHFGLSRVRGDWEEGFEGAITQLSLGRTRAFLPVQGEAFPRRWRGRAGVE